MYIAASRTSDLASGTDRKPALKRVSANVVALGMVSLVTDVSSEMVTAVLPLYLVLGLGLNPLQFGLLDGLYAGATALVRVLGGHLADRWRRLKAVAGFGYGLSAVGKLGLVAAGSSVAAIGLVLAADRTGKGLRTGPRDALISLSSEPASLGRSFGVHRAMDTVGAFLGPLVAMAVLAVSLGSYSSVFVTSFCIAAIAVLLLALFVRERPGSVDRAAVSARAALGLLRQQDFRRVTLWAALLGLVTVGDSFVYLVLQRRWEIAATYFPLLPLGTAGVYLLLAVPLGKLADRAGRWPVFLGGHAALCLALVLLCGPQAGLWLAVVALGLHGVFYAATDGVLMAAAGPLIPADLRATGLAVVQTGQAVARMCSSVLFGLAWTLWDLRPAVLVAAVCLAAVALAAAFAKPVRP
ncbi:major facilitator transporter [Amycolatopsis mediterranei S699]|uniref:Major facilitator transporter n=2 Tax=Amycolatopsis mediterranei TaxID=33910 RepID=A0A0H3D0H7_AMYMU|nr:MFS transporter [Amycolatopsis mediterranei]ADJ43689.1 major facilitator transporter [Amycolatopsis mediterranei U32]AEK40397.1 major facilitator transporter [Amycolatopsis mediterranei S699]AFO75401.1 major facilitator transporter [Amycolatopsis mediterranei S699]AGT82530.1 major facilitator transporter [Amycolatopsis mediterranei RB]KDO10219.1 MFS transporter [Amycolatopsis mediterranei]